MGIGPSYMTLTTLLSIGVATHDAHIEVGNLNLNVKPLLLDHQMIGNTFTVGS